MPMIAVGDCYRLDAAGNILDPAGNVICSREQQPVAGVVMASIDMLNQVYRHGRTARRIDEAAQADRTADLQSMIYDAGTFAKVESWLFQRIAELKRSIEVLGPEFALVEREKKAMLETVIRLMHGETIPEPPRAG